METCYQKSGNASLNCDEFEKSSVGSKITSDPDYLSLNCDGFETAIRRGRNKPVIGESVRGGGLADRQLYAEYKKAMVAAISSPVSTRLSSLSCSCSGSSCHIGSKVSQVTATLEGIDSVAQTITRQRTGLNLEGINSVAPTTTRFCEDYKKADCDCSSIGCHVPSKSSQVDSRSAEKFKGRFDRSEVEALKANEAPWVYESGGK